MNKAVVTGLQELIEWMDRVEQRLAAIEERLVSIDERLLMLGAIEERLSVIERKPDAPPVAEERNWTLKDFAPKMNMSVYTIQRAISHGKIPVTYFGKKPVILHEDAQRLFRTGLPSIPQGYKAKKDRPTVRKQRGARQKHR